jgi:hypothetical protein
MSDIESTAPASAGTGDGIAPYNSGQAADQAPAGSVSTQSRSEEPRSSTEAETVAEQPAQQPESPIGWKTLQDAARDYKALQRAYTKSHQVLSQLGDLNQVAQERAILAQLRDHPGFIDWVTAEIAKEQAGSADPQTIKALEIVRNQVQQGIQEAVAPLYAAHVENKVRTVFSELDKELGTEWQQLKPKMNEILQTWKRQGLVSPRIEQNFDYSFVKSLAAAAMLEDPSFAAKAYEKRLQAKQANVTTSQPGTAAAAVSSAPVSSMREAYALAKRQHGVA